MSKHAFVAPQGWDTKKPLSKVPAKKAAAVKKTAKASMVGAHKSADVDESAALSAAHAMAQRMLEVGGIDKKTMREFDDLCLPKVPQFSKTMITKIRKDANVSQNLFAKYLNTSASTVQQWETGAKKPSGAAAKLLQIVKKHGIEVLG